VGSSGFFALRALNDGIKEEGHGDCRGLFVFVRRFIVRAKALTYPKANTGILRDAQDDGGLRRKGHGGCRGPFT